MEGNPIIKLQKGQPNHLSRLLTLSLYVDNSFDLRHPLDFAPHLLGHYVRLQMTHPPKPNSGLKEEARKIPSESVYYRRNISQVEYVSTNYFTCTTTRLFSRSSHRSEEETPGPWRCFWGKRPSGVNWTITHHKQCCNRRDIHYCWTRDETLSPFTVCPRWADSRSLRDQFAGT